MVDDLFMVAETWTPEGLFATGICFWNGVIEE